MFGYTLPLYSKMSPGDIGTYRRYYCETCHQLKDGFGLVSSLAVNYDMTFNTLVLNAVNGDVLDFKGTKKSFFCVLKDSQADSDLMRGLAAYTLLLTKWELTDDDTDKPSLKTDLISFTLGRAIEKAEKLYPEYDRIIGDGFSRLRAMELDGCTDAVYMGREFGKSLAVALNDFAGNKRSDNLEHLFVELTALIYLLDAADDLDEDCRDGTYNPLLEAADGFVNKRKYIDDNIYALTDTFNSVMGSLQKAYGYVREDMRTNRGVTDNIVYLGLPESAKNVLSGSSQAKASLKNVFTRHRERNASY